VGEDRKDGWMSSFTSPLLQVGEDRIDGWISSFTVVLYYKWVKIGRMDGCLVLQRTTVKLDIHPSFLSSPTCNKGLQQN
jgi:hypothetical protein